MEYDLAGAKRIFAKTVNSLPSAQGMQATRALEGYFFEREGRIWIRATVEDLRTARTVGHIEFDGPVASGFLPLANELARRISRDARRFGTSSESAFRFYGEALAASDPQAMERALDSAIAADPGFAAGYRDQAELLAETGAKERAMEVIQAGERERLDSIDRANLQSVAAAISGDGNARVQALETLAHFTPANATLFADLGAMEYVRRDFREAVRDFREATALNPEEPSSWNQLGYALAWTQNLNGARQALDQYQKLSPGDTNTLDSLGEVSFFLGDFESAAKYFEQAGKRVQAEYLKAAEARLLLGDLRGADGLFAKYIGPSQGAQQGREIYQTAQWEFLTGRRANGIAMMEKLAPGLDPDAQALALSQLAIWKLEMGDRKAAMDFANQAVAHAQTPQTRGLAGVSRFIAAGTGTKSGSALVDGYALLFAGKYREALAPLQAAYQAASPSNDGQIRVLLAWARVDTGGLTEAGKLLEMCPLPLSSGEPLFASMIFPRYFALQAAVLEKQGKAGEAKRDRELYVKYGGDATK